MPAEGRLRKLHRARRGRDAATFHNAHERAQQGEVFKRCPSVFEYGYGEPPATRISAHPAWWRCGEGLAVEPLTTIKHKTKNQEQAMDANQNKVAIVTGSSRGIRAAVAKQLAADGLVVVINYAGRTGDAEKVV